MIVVLVLVVLFVGVVTLAVALGALRSSRRAEHLGEDRYELLRDQQERLQLLREERRMLLEKLEQESLERRHFVEALKGEGSQLLADTLERERKRRTELARRGEQQKQERLRLEQELQGLRDELERERQEHSKLQQLAEELQREHKERSGIKQKMERLEQERQRLTEDLQKERGEQAEIQRRAEQRDQERVRLENELQRLQAELDSWRRASTPEQAKESEERSLWRRRPALVIGLLFGALAAWLVSLVVALSLLTS